MDSIAGVFIKESAMRKGKPIHAQAREIIYSVYQYFVKESFRFKKYTGNEGSSYFQKVQERVVAATGISRNTVGRILTEAENASDLIQTPSTPIKFCTPKIGTMRKALRVDLDKFDYDVIRKTVYDFHLKYHELPTLKSLTSKLSQRIDYKGSEDTLRRVLTDMGLRFNKIGKNKKLLVEKHDVRLKRIEYLEKIRQYRAEGKNIVYISETTINLSAGDNSKKNIKKQKGVHLVLVHAGNEVGFVPEAFLMYQFTDTKIDYQNYENWLRNKLIVNIPKHSVLVVEDKTMTENNNKYFEKPPNFNTIKQKMISWLHKHGISVDTTLPKPKIYAIVCRYKESISDFTVDKILAEQGHITLRMPPYHAELNPIESIWSQLKGYVVATKKIGNVTIDSAKILLQEKINLFGAEELKELCQKTIKREDEYLKEEHALDEYLDNLVLNDGYILSDSEFNDSSDSDMEVIELED